MAISVLISACLLGTACRYDGAEKPCPEAIALAKKVRLIPFCPEIYGGLETPRFPCEIQGEKVISKDGQDRTEQYQKGARQALKMAETFGCRFALLKEKSPSCGAGSVYDGTFSRTLKSGDGITASLLKQKGIQVFGESQIPQLLAAISQSTRASQLQFNF